MMSIEERINSQGWTIITSYVKYKNGDTIPHIVQDYAGIRKIEHPFVIAREVTKAEYVAELVAMGAKKDRLTYRDYYYVVKTD